MPPGREGDGRRRPEDGEPETPAADQRAEMRAEAQAYEQLAARDRLRGRGLVDVAAELVSRGDRVAVHTSSRTFTGVLVYAAGDLACLRTLGGHVDLNLAAPLTIRVVERVAAGGVERGHGPASFAARLAEHEAAGAPVELGTRGGQGRADGVILAVGADHVVLDAEGETWYVARAAIDYVQGSGTG